MISCDLILISILSILLFRNLSNLQVLDVKNNLLAGLPDELGNCPLVRLEVNDNHLSDIPDVLYKVTTLMVCI